MNALELYNLLAEKSAESLAGYLEYLMVDSDPPVRLSRVIEPWQSKLYDILTPLFAAATGHGTTIQRACFITAPKGVGKTSTVAQFINWALCFAKRPIAITAAAADKDQAGILLGRMQKEASQNPWLANKLKFKNYQAIGPTGTLDVISSDAPTSSGRLDDIIICDEITFWKKRDLWDMLLAARHKRKNCILIIISNSGLTDTWQHELWLEATSNPRAWITYEIAAWSASWLDHDEIAEDRKLLLPAMFKRLHLNSWTDPTEDSGYITRQQITACVHEYQPSTTARRYIASIDYGSVNDRAVAVLVHDEADTIILDNMTIWQGSKGNPVPLSEIEAWITDVINNHRVIKLTLDPYQLEQTAQKFERHVEVEKFNFGGGSHFRLAETFRTFVLNHRLHIYPDAGSLILPDGRKETLIDEIAALIVEEKPGNQYRVNHMPGKHDDRYSALAMAVLGMAQLIKHSDPTPLLEKLLEKPQEEIEMFDQIKYIQVYGTYQITPIINGDEYKLMDFATMYEAAWAVNEVHKLLESTPPNNLDAKKYPTDKRQSEIKSALIKELTQKKLLPLAIKKKEKVEVK